MILNLLVLTLKMDWKWKTYSSRTIKRKISSLKKFDAIFLKHNEFNDDVINSIKNYNPKLEIFNTSYQIKNLNKFDFSKKYLIFSGIGNPNNFRKILQKNKFNLIDEIIYPDHFEYKIKDINYIIDRAKKNDAEIITTEKDFVKISKLDDNKINFVEIDLKIDDEKNLLTL